MTSETIHVLRRALWAVLVISIGGVLFSGILTYRELTGGVASCTIGGAPAAIFGLPVCVYGLAMYAVLTAIAALTLFRTRYPDGLRETDGQPLTARR